MSTSLGDPYSSEISEIANATSFDDVDEIMGRFSAIAPAGSDGAALYCGYIGGKSATPIVDGISENTDLAMIGKTPFGKFLGDPQVADETKKTLTRLFKEDGSSAALADAQAKAYMFGDGTQTPGLTSNADSLWGSRSRTFVESVSGPITVIGTSAPDDRILPDVELQAALANPNVTSVGGISTSSLRSEVESTGGNYKATLGEIQQPFRVAVDRGIFREANGSIVFSREFAQQLDFANSDRFEPKAVLESRGDLTAVTLDALPDYSASFTPTSLPLVDPAPALTPAELALERHLDPADRDALAPAPVATDPIVSASVAETGKFPFGKIASGAGNALTIVETVAAAYETDQQYHALQQNGNAFAANDLVRTQAIDTVASDAGSFAGDFAAGATYSAIAGEETGPVVDAVISLAGGVVGGIVGKAFGGDISEYLTERDVKLNTGTDGRTYQFLNGSWQTTHFPLDVMATDRPAPASQIPTLEMERATKLTDLAMANPSKLDPNHISAKDDAGRTQSWTRTGPGNWEAISLQDFKVERASPAVTSQLEQQSALRTAIGPTSADFAAKGFVVDYYGQHWDALKPMPESVVSQLHLQSETSVTDPGTGITWQVDGNSVSRVVAQSQENAIPGPQAKIVPPPSPVAPPIAPLAPQAGVPQGTTVSPPAAPSALISNRAPQPSPEEAPDPMVTVKPTPAEFARVIEARDAAVLSNRAYGQNLIKQEFTAMNAAKAAGVPYVPGTTTMPPIAAAPLTPASGGPSSPNPPTAPASSGAPSPDLTANVALQALAAVQARVNALRGTGTYLPDVTSVQPYAPQASTGSFVHVDDDTVAQHLGRGIYQIASVSQNLNGQTPPEGQPVSVSARGQVAPTAPVLARASGRME